MLIHQPLLIKKFYKAHNVYEIWECDFKQQYQISQYDKDLCNIILDREELFYGGRTEVFSAYANDTDTHKIEYHDVCSLYPTVCTHDVLPTGFPTRYFGEKAREQRSRLNPNHMNPIFGYVRCHIWPNQHCRLALLPEHKDKKLMFDLIPKKVLGLRKKYIWPCHKDMKYWTFMKYYTLIVCNVHVII